MWETDLSLTASQGSGENQPRSVAASATGDRRYTIMPAATVSLVPGSMRMSEPVVRFLRYES